jgi:hypothetical protein
VPRHSTRREGIAAINSLTLQMHSLKKKIRLMRKRALFVDLAKGYCAVWLTLSLAATGSAQDSSADRASLTQNQAPYGPGVSSSGLTDGHAVASPNDADLGEQEILKRQEAYQPFTVMVGAPFYWTSNVALTSTDEQDDFIIAPSAGVYYQPRFSRTLYGLIDVRDQQFYYDRFDDFDFGSFDVDAGLIYIVPSLDNLVLRLIYNYNRLTKKNSFDDFYSNNAILLNAELPVPLGRAQRLFFGANAYVSVAAEQERPRRDDYEAYVGYDVSLTRAFSIDVVGRMVVRDYIHQDSRVDTSEILSLTANYQVTKCFTASAISTFVANQSNHSVFDYTVANMGGAVSLAIKF